MTDSRTRRGRAGIDFARNQKIFADKEAVRTADTQRALMTESAEEWIRHRAAQNELLRRKAFPNQVRAVEDPAVRECIQSHYLVALCPKRFKRLLKS